MARVGLGTLGFYLLTGLLAAIVMPVVYIGLFVKGGKLLLILAGPLVAAGLLIYARLVGRLGLLIRRLNPPNEKPGDRPRKKKTVKEEPAAEEPEMLEVADRSDEDDEWSGGSYAMSREAAGRTPKYVSPSEEDFNDMGPKLPEAGPDPEPVVTPRKFDDEDEEWSGGSYGMKEEPKPAASQQIQTSAEFRKHAPKPKRRRKTPPAPIGPAHPLLQGVFTFPWYGHSFGAWLWLAIGLTILGVLVGACIAFYPSGGDASLRVPPPAWQCGPAWSATQGSWKGGKGGRSQYAPVIVSLSSRTARSRKVMPSMVVASGLTLPSQKTNWTTPLWLLPKRRA
jgi:hypothetical protein